MCGADYSGKERPGTTNTGMCKQHGRGGRVLLADDMCSSALPERLLLAGAGEDNPTMQPSPSPVTFKIKVPAPAAAAAPSEAQCKEAKCISSTSTSSVKQ